MRKIFILLLCMLLMPVGYSFARGVGTSAANFLKIGQGARPNGMGGAFVALADDINCIEWNPAGLSTLQPDYFDAGFEHVFWFDDVEYEIFTFAQNLGDTYGAGLQLWYRHMPDIDNDLSDEKPLQVYDFAGIIGYGLQISNFSVGINLKFVLSQLGTEQLTGEAADLGMLVNFMENKLVVGLSIQNLGPDIKSDSLPLNIRGGFAFKETYGEEKEHGLNAALEINQPLDNKLNLQLGVEYWYVKTFSARIGYRQQLGGNDLQSDNVIQRLTAGASIKWADLQLDYAYVPYADLGGVHRLSLILHYGPLSNDISKF
ncbi:PorV/PorQ family protein [bacterium]|nr:PorV/PorQ family protein [bacterium]